MVAKKPAAKKKPVHVLFLFALACCSFSSALAFKADGISLQTLGQITGQALSFSLTRDGRVLYLVDFIAGLRVFDVSDPIKFDVIENVATPGKPQYGALSIDESKLFIADGHKGLSIFDVRNPRLVTLSASFAIPGGAIEIVRVASNDMVFVSQDTSGIKAINVSSVTSPTITQNVSLTWNSLEYAAFRLQVSADGSVLCALARSSNSEQSMAVRLFIFSRAGANSDLVQAYSAEVESGQDIALTRDGRYLFMTTSASTDASFATGLHRFDLAAPSNPILVRPSTLDTTSPLVNNQRATEDGAWLVYLNSDETRLYVESNSFAVFELDTNRNVRFAVEADLKTSNSDAFYPVSVVESPDGGILYAGAGFGQDAISLLSLSSTATMNIPSTTGVNLISSTDRISVMTVDGAFALFIQRDPSGSGDKGKLTAFKIGTASSFFTFVLNIPWAASDRLRAEVTQTQLFVTNYGPSSSSSGTAPLKYEFPLTTLSTVASRVKSAPPPPPPAVLLPPPPPPASFIDGSVRLVDGNDQYSGRVEFYYSGSWGTVCDDAFGLEEGKVICQQLFGTSVNNTFAGAYYGQGSGPIYLDDLACSGSESALGNCQMTQYTTTWSWSSWSYVPTPTNVTIDGSSIDNSDCSHYEDASVQCAAPTAPSSPIPVGDIRLVGGLNEFEGRVEIYSGTSWGTVCDDSFDMYGAEVVCRQVGGKFSNGIMKAFNFDTSVPGSGTIHLDEVSCAGTESRLIDCPANAIGSHDCIHSEDVYVRCVHEVLAPANTYQFAEGILPGTDVFDEVSKTWYASTQSSGSSNVVRLTAMNFAQSNAPTTNYLNMAAISSGIRNMALSGDRRAIFLLDQNEDITTVDVTNVASMKTHSLSNLKSFKRVRSLVSSPSRDVMVSVHSSSLLLVNTSTGLNADIIGSYVPTCLLSSNSFDEVRINGDESRIFVSHARCAYKELIDSRTLSVPRIIAAVDVLPSSHVDTVFHNETSYLVFAKDSSSGTHDVRQGKIERQDVDMLSAPTRVGIDLMRQVNPASGVTISDMKLAGSSDDLSVTGLSFGSNLLSGVVDKSYAGKDIDLLLTYAVGGNNRHAVFSLHVDSTIRAAVASSALTLSSPEPLLQLTLEIPENVAASFVTTDALGIQFAPSNQGHTVSLFGVQGMLNEALSKLRYHSLITESLIRVQAVKVTVTDLFSPELEIGELGAPNFTLSNLNYNAHPYLTVQAIPHLRFTIGDRFTFAFNESLFKDDDDTTLAYTLRTATDAALPPWLDFDAVNSELTGSVDSALASNGRVFSSSQNRYELVVPLKLSATDGYTTKSATFQLLMYNYPPRTLANQVVVDTTIGSERTANMSSYFQDEDLNAGGSLKYSILSSDQGVPAPAWIKIDPETGFVSVSPVAESTGSFTFKVSASDGLNDAVHVVLSVNVKRTDLLMFYYAITLALTALGGLSSVFAAYKYVWIVKNIIRSKKNWTVDVPQVRSIDDLEALITSYRIRAGDKSSELVDSKAVYSLQVVQLLPPKWYFRVLSPTIRKWVSCKPLRDGRAIPTWLEMNKNQLTFTFLKRAFQISVESGTHYVLLIKEQDGSTIDTLDIDLTRLSDGLDEEMGGKVARK